MTLSNIVAILDTHPVKKTGVKICQSNLLKKLLKKELTKCELFGILETQLEKTYKMIFEN